jgi:hypothetical protein
MGSGDLGRWLALAIVRASSVSLRMLIPEVHPLL